MHSRTARKWKEEQGTRGRESCQWVLFNYTKKKRNDNQLTSSRIIIRK
jgi:hypothetical protein